MKKKVLIIIVIIVALILLFPIPMQLKDGGSIEFKALLYSVTKIHKLAPIDEGADVQYIEGISIKILGMEIYKKTDKVIVCTVEEDEPKESNTDTQVNNSFVGTVLEETTTYMIVEPNEDEIERKSADKIMINYGTDHRDYLYGIGRKVIINYTGAIMETYPAQINTDNILINGYEDFELTVEKANNDDAIKILNNTELYKNNSDYDLYYYGLNNVNIRVDNKTMSLEEALRSGKMTLDGLIIKANKDFPENVSYDDGGSMEYHYKDYTIIKHHKLDGNRDIYICPPETKIHDIPYRGSPTLEISGNGITNSITIMNKNNNKIVDILESLSYNQETCDGLGGYEIKTETEEYYLMSCGGVEKNNKRADISEADLNTIKSIIQKYIEVCK